MASGGKAALARGKRAEIEVVHCLRRAGYEAATYRALSGGTQRGADIVSDFPAILEVKDHQKIDLPAFWLQAVEQAGDRIPGLIVKRRGHGRAEDWWYVSDVRTQIGLIHALRSTRSDEG